MPRIYDTLPEETRARYPLADLDTAAQKALSMPVPASWTPEKAQRAADLVGQIVPQAAAVGVRQRAVREGRIRVTPEGRIAPPETPRAGLWERAADVVARSLPDLGLRHAEETLDALTPAAPNQGEAMRAILSRMASGEGIPENPRVGPARNLAEHAVDLAAGVAGFTATAAATAPVLGPFSLAAAGAAPAGTPRQRFIRGGTTQAAGSVAGEAAGAIQQAAARKGLPWLLGAAASRVPAAAAFGAAQPVAENVLERATGPHEGLPGIAAAIAPGPSAGEMAAGAGKLFLWDMLFGGHGGRTAEARTSPAEAVERPARLSLPQARIPVSRRLPASTSGAEVIEAGPGESPAPAVAQGPRRQIADAGLPGEPRPMPQRQDRGAWIVGRFGSAADKASGGLASDSRAVGRGGLTVGQVFRQAVSDQLRGTDPALATRQDVKQAARAVASHPDMQRVVRMADALQEPPVRVSNEVRQRSIRYSNELTARAGGRSVVIDTPNGPARAIVGRVQVFDYPGVADPVRLVVIDPDTGQPEVLRYGSVAEMSQAVNNPQSLAKAEDVFARSERPAEQRTAPGTPQAPGPAPRERPARMSKSEARRMAAGKVASAPPAERVESRPVPAAAPPAPAEGRAAAKRPDLFAFSGESASRVSAPSKPEAPREAEKPVRKAPAEPAAERPRGVLDLPVRDAKSAQRLVENLNRKSPDLEARIEQRRGQTVITVNRDAKTEEAPAARPPEAKRPTEAPPPTEAPGPEKAAPTTVNPGGIEESPAGSRSGEKGGAAEVAGETATPPAGDFREAFHAAVRESNDPKADHARIADVVERLSGKPRPEGFDSAAEFGAAMAGRAEQYGGKYKPGDRVTVPHTGKAKGVERERGEVVGFDRAPDGSWNVRVSVTRGSGRGTPHEVVHPEASLVRRPSKAANPAEAARRTRAYQQIRDEAAGDLGAARVMLEQHQATADHLEAQAKSFDLKDRTDENEEYRKLSNQRDVQARVLRAAKQAHSDMLAEHRERTIESAKAAWDEHAGAAKGNERLKAKFHEAAEDHVFATPEEAGGIARVVNAIHAHGEAPRIASGGIRDLHFGIARGVGFVEQARAIRAAGKDLGFSDEADLQTADMLEKLFASKPFADASPTEARDMIDAILPPGPADMIPPGVTPIAPFDWGAESGKVSPDMLGLSWLAHLWRMGREGKKARDQMPREDKSVTYRDPQGNVRAKEPLNLYEPDYYAQSAFTRMMSVVGIEPGLHVLTPDQHVLFKSGESERVQLEGSWNLALTTALPEAALKRLRPFSAESKSLGELLDGDRTLASVSPALRDCVLPMLRLYKARFDALQATHQSLGKDPLKSDLARYTAFHEVADTPRGLLVKVTERGSGRQSWVPIQRCYSGPHQQLGIIGESLDAGLTKLVSGDKNAGLAEVREMRQRYLMDRNGDYGHVQDAMLAWSDYNRATAKYEANLPFWERVSSDLADMGIHDKHRAAAILNWIRSSLMRNKPTWQRQMESGFANLVYAKGRGGLSEITVDDAARQLGVPAGVLAANGVRRAYAVEPGTKLLGNSTVAGTVKRGSTPKEIHTTTGGHLFRDTSGDRLRAPIEKFVQTRIRLRALRDAAVEGKWAKMGGAPGEILDPNFTLSEHEQMRVEAWRKHVESGEYDLLGAFFKGIGDRQTRAVLGRNLRSAFNNSQQNLLTTVPELGFRATAEGYARQIARPAAHWSIDRLLKAGKITPEEAAARKQAWPVGRRTAEMVGALQSEVSRVEELTASERSALKMLYDNFGPMAPFRMAEDFTRGVNVLSSAVIARRLGYGPEVASSFAREGTREYFREWSQRIEAMRTKGSPERLAAIHDSESMFDYGPLGRSPVFSLMGPFGDVLGRLMTFRTRFFRQYYTRPVGAALKTAGAVVRGVTSDYLRRASGGQIDLKPDDPARDPSGKTFDPVSYGTYPRARSGVERWLESYGAKWHDRHGLGVLVRQSLVMGGAAAAASMTNLSLNMLGTAGWQTIPLMLVSSYLPPGKLKRRIDDFVAESARTDVISPAEGPEGSMSPAASAVYETLSGMRTGFQKMQAAAKRGDPNAAWGSLLGMYAAQSQEMGLQQVVPNLVALRRFMQQLPGNDRFFQSEPGKLFARLTGTRTYISGNDWGEAALGNLGLRSQRDDAAARRRVKPYYFPWERPARSRVATYSY